MAQSALDGSIQRSSKAGDVSLARQRRRRTIKRSETRNLSQNESQNGDTRSLSLTQSSESLATSTQPPDMINDDDNSLSTTTISRPGTARQRRTQRKRESLHKREIANIKPEETVLTPHHKLEDSTAGVARILEKNLDQVDRGDKIGKDQVPQGEVIVNHSTESPDHHTNEEHTELEGPIQTESDPSVNGEAVPVNYNV